MNRFLPEGSVSEINKCQKRFPAAAITLGYLEEADVEHILHTHSERYRLNWDQVRIRQLAALTSGYPLGIAEMLKHKKEAV